MTRNVSREFQTLFKLQKAVRRFDMPRVIWQFVIFDWEQLRRHIGTDVSTKN